MRNYNGAALMLDALPPAKALLVYKRLRRGLASGCGDGWMDSPFDLKDFEWLAIAPPLPQSLAACLTSTIAGFSTASSGVCEPVQPPFDSGPISRRYMRDH